MREETPQQKKAFDFYCQLILTDMSVDDSLTEIIKECGVSKRTVYRWKKDFNWDDRVLLKQKDIEDGVSVETRETLNDIKAKLIKIVKNPLLDVLTEIEKGNKPVTVKTTGDIDRLVKLLLVIYGEANEISTTKTDVDVNINDRINKYREYIDTLDK